MVAKRRLKLGRDDWRNPGDPVPEARRWKNLRAYTNTGKIEDMSEDGWADYVEDLEEAQERSDAINNAEREAKREALTAEVEANKSKAQAELEKVEDALKTAAEKEEDKPVVIKQAAKG